MIRFEFDKQRGQCTLHVDDEGLSVLREAVEDASGGGKVFIGDPGAMLILRPTSWHPDPGGPDE